MYRPYDRPGPEPIGFLLIPKFSAMAFFSAIEPLRVANRLAGRAIFRWQVFSEDGEPVEASSGMRLIVDGAIDAAAGLPTVIVCAGFDPAAAETRHMLATLRRLARAGTMLGALDTGAHLLARAGLADTVPVTMHWEAVPGFREDFPDIAVSDELFEVQGQIFTCAGGTAALDMMLDMIGRKHGAALALQMPKSGHRGDQPHSAIVLEEVYRYNLEKCAGVHRMSCNIKSILQRRIAPGLSALILSTAVFGTAHATPQETILYRFGARDPGGMPLVMDSTGALYNVTYEFEKNIGDIETLFRLSPPAAPAKVWQFEPLRRFSPQDQIEGVGVSYLAVVPNSNTLYGVTLSGGRCAPTSVETSCGTAFSLSPPASGHKVWGFDSIFRFGKAAVTANTPDYIAVGSDGALYGDSLNGIGTTVHTYGTVFKLSPPAVSGGTWSNTVLYSFKGGVDGEYGYLLPPDSTGTIYGQNFDGGISNSCGGCGTFFELTPPSVSGTEWTKTTLYTFQGREDGFGPDSILISDSSGSYYGVTAYGGGTSCFGRTGCGTIFRLSPPSAGETNWSETVLYRFRGGSDGSFPRGKLAIDQSGAIYGSTAVDPQGGSTLGTVWKLTPPSQGQTEWTKTVLHHFAGGADGLNPDTGVILDSTGAIYGIAEQGGSPELAGHGAGVIFKITQ